jgi:hypothetical protein
VNLISSSFRFTGGIDYPVDQKESSPVSPVLN